MPFSIRSRLLLLVLSVLLPAAAAAVWMILQTYADERTMLERNLRDTTRALSLVVDRELTQRAAIARVLSLSTALDSAPALSDAQLATFTMQARPDLPDGGQPLLRGQALGAVDVERDECTGGCGDVPAVVEREKALRQDALVDGPVDVPKGDTSDHGGLGRPQHVRNRTHGDLRNKSSDVSEYIVSVGGYQWLRRRMKRPRSPSAPGYKTRLGIRRHASRRLPVWASSTWQR